METVINVIVVGSGVAGLSAAVAAAQSGASVVIVDRAEEGSHGGNTRYTEAFLRMKTVDEASDDFEDRFIDNAGYHIDPNLLQGLAEPGRSAALSGTAAFLDPDIISTLAGEAGPTLRWLETAGISFQQADTPFITASTTRLAPVGGGLALVETLTGVARKLGVEFRFSTTARDLSLDGAGRVNGLIVSDSDGTSVLSARSVVLASGGFQGNAEMLARYMPDARYARPVAIGGYYNRGEGIDMALKIGAAAAGDFNHFHNEPIDPRSGMPEAAIFAFGYGILVNKRGERFVDEASGTSDATYEAVTRQIIKQPDGIAYAVFGATIDQVPNVQRGIRTDVPPVTADTLEALAEALSLPVEALEETVASYNAACGSGRFSPLELDGLSTSGLPVRKSNWAAPIEGPFRAYPVISANVFTFGGLKIDSEARVLDTDGRTIEGLYAAGETTGIYFGTYTGSTSVLRGAVFGRIAGMHSATNSH